MPDVIGPYRLHEEIGRGGMSIVYAATDSRNQQQVALKVLPPEFAHNPTFLNRFVKEGENAVRLRHPNIVRTFEASKAGSYHYIAMELAQKGTLSDRMKTGKGLLPEAMVVETLRQAAAGLDYAHGLGMVHRDIKPSNIIFASDGRAMIADFGVAKELASDYTQVTMPGFSVGTPAYMAPEQARGDMDLDRRADIYSLGVVAYALLTGKMPFEAPSQLLLLRKIVDEMPPPADKMNPNIHPGAAYVLHHVLAKDPDARYQSAGEFVSQLAAVLAQPHWESSGGMDATVAMIPLTPGSRPPAFKGSPPPAYQPSRPSAPPPPYRSTATRQDAQSAEARPERRWSMNLVWMGGLLVVGLLIGVFVLPRILSPSEGAATIAEEQPVLDDNVGQATPPAGDPESGEAAQPAESSNSAVSAAPDVAEMPSRLLEPVSDALLDGETARFVWQRQERLASDEALELVFWSAETDIDGWKEGIAPAGLQREGEQGEWQVNLDLLSLPLIYGPELEKGDYFWGIVRVQLQPEYRRMMLESDARLFSFQLPDVTSGVDAAEAKCTGPLCNGR